MRLPTTISCLLALLSGSASLAAQGNAIVVPAAHASAEAPGTEFWAFSPFPARRQVLVDGAHLAAALRRTFWSVAVRRNMGDPAALQEGVLALEVWLSHTGVSAAAPHFEFARNRGKDHRLVFQGEVRFPACPPAPSSPAPWAAPFAVTLPFSTPFPYLGGTLCLETVTARVREAGGALLPAPWWTIDAVTSDPAGTVSLFGTSCIPGMGALPAGVDPATASLGATAVFFLRGPKRTGLAVCAVGTNDRTFSGLPLPFDLSRFGATGCALYTDWVWTKGAAVSAPPGGQTGYAGCELELPADPSLLGASMFGQWLFLDPTANPLGFTLSNGVKATLGAAAPQLGFGWVEATDLASTSGRVLPGRAPVLLFSLARR
jgi:hypothetical protein